MTKISLKEENQNSESIDSFTNTLIDKITKNLERFHYNVIVANFHEAYNFLIKEIEKPINNLKLLENYKKILVLLQPVIPHFALECLVEIDSKYKAEWPLVNLNLIKKEMFNIVIQINGKKRGLLVCESETTEEQLIEQIKTDEDIHKFIMDKKIKKSIYITNKLINIITE